MNITVSIYKVYVRTDEQDCIVAINSSAFLADTEGWTQIDEGAGDRYHHAQGNYLDGPLMDEQCRYRYKLENGSVVARTAEELAADVLPEAEPTLADRNRADIDYLAMIGGVEL